MELIQVQKSQLNAQLTAETQRYVSDLGAETSTYVAELSTDTQLKIAEQRAELDRYLGERNLDLQEAMSAADRELRETLGMTQLELDQWKAAELVPFQQLILAGQVHAILQSDNQSEINAILSALGLQTEENVVYQGVETKGILGDVLSAAIDAIFTE